MSISTLQSIQPRSEKSSSKSINVLVIIPAVIIALIAVFFGKNIINSIKGIGGKSAIAVDVSNGRAEVFINDENIGVTPYEAQNIKPGANKVTIRSSNRVYETTIKFLSNNDKYIHKVGVFRDLGISDLFSAGQDLWFEEDTTDTVLRIISDPNGASVFIDNTEIGKTPFTSSKLSEGDYDLRVEKVGYESQKARIRIQNGYTSNISVRLFPMPVPSRVSPFEGSTELYDISSDNNLITADTQTWVKGAVYWNQTRGINLEGIGLNKDLVFDYFIDYKGTIYNGLGNAVEDPATVEISKESPRGAYMGRVSDGIGLTDPAKESFSTLKGTKILTTSNNLVEILETGLGWLRVRSEPSTGATELAKVDVGKQYPFISEISDWTRIKVSEDVEGWVSSKYVKKVTTDGTGSPIMTTDGTKETIVTNGTGL